MYVCICNAVTEDDVRGCVASGACSTKEVKAATNWKPGCGSCTQRLCSTIIQARLDADLPAIAICDDTVTDGDAQLSSCHDRVPWKATRTSSAC